MDTPDRVGYVVGVRWWRRRRLLGDDGWVLTSPLYVAASAWPPGRPLRAMCLPRGCEAPAERCRCGIYAFRDPEHLLTHVQGWYSDPELFAVTTIERVVFGAVALWGEVIEHERGYRAEYAYPLGLWVPPRWRKLYPQVEAIHRALGERYRIPVVYEWEELL